MREIEILDTTLRDGAQCEGISFSMSDKLAIVDALDLFGVKYIEAGNPGASPKDMEFFKRLSGKSFKNSKICAFGSTRRKGVAPKDDAGLGALLESGAKSLVIFGKSWDLHATEILKVSLSENLDMITSSVAYLKAEGREVIFDAEHFFDGYRANPDYAVSALRAAADGGADVLCLCDTNGGCFPWEIGEVTAKICSLFPAIRIGVHCHDDIDCATASSIAAAENGASHIQGTFIGFGERTGNADLSAIIPSLQLKRGFSCISGELSTLRETAVKIAESANIFIPACKAYVGRSAFAHKAGMHADGVTKLARSFEHIDPALVGNERRFLISEMSGRSAIFEKIREIAPELTRDSPEVAMIIQKIKEFEHEGYQFEAAQASLEILVLKLLNKYTPFFELVNYRITGELPPPDGIMPASAIMQVNVEGRTEVSAAVGSGPVHALDLALRRALLVFYPELEKMHLSDYKVRVLDAGCATASRVRVLIESTDGERVWSSVGVSDDIIEASWLALKDSIEYKLLKYKK